MPALQRALALAEVNHVAVRVGQHLDLDMARPRDQALDEHALVAEPGLRLAARALQRRVELVGRIHDPHAAPAAASRGLDQQRISRGPRLDLRKALRRPGFRPAWLPPWRAACLPSARSPPAAVRQRRCPLSRTRARVQGSQTESHSQGAAPPRPCPCTRRSARRSRDTTRPVPPEASRACGAWRSAGV